MPKKFYLASGVIDRNRAQELSRQIQERLKWECTSTWFDIDAKSKVPAPELAQRCLRDIDEADVFIMHDISRTRGKWFECGYALAKGKKVFHLYTLTGIANAPLCPVFTYHPDIVRVNSQYELVDALKTVQ